MKYRNGTFIPTWDAVVELSKIADENITNSFIITKKLKDCGFSEHETKIPIPRIPALPFLYLFGWTEVKRRGGKMQDTKSIYNAEE